MGNSFKFGSGVRAAAAFRAFRRAREGATAIEYAIIAGGVSVVIVAAVLILGATLETDYYGKIADLFG